MAHGWMDDSASFGMEEPGKAASAHICIATTISQVKSVLITSGYVWL